MIEVSQEIKEELGDFVCSFFLFFCNKTVIVPLQRVIVSCFQSSFANEFSFLPFSFLSFNYLATNPSSKCLSFAKLYILTTHRKALLSMFFMCFDFFLLLFIDIILAKIINF